MELTSTCKNLFLSFSFLYGSKKLVDFTKTKISYRYPRISNYILPIGYIFGLHMSKVYLGVASTFPTSAFWKYLLESYSFAYSFSYGLSLTTFIIGYPTINILFNIGNNYATNFIRSYDGYFRDVVNVAVQMKDCLEKNKNWDITYRGISIKTWTTPQPIVSDENLNKVAPLRYFENASDSKFLEACNICFDQIDSKKLHRELPCKHVFHPECIDGWLMKCNSTCPICRKSVYDQ